MPERAGNGDLAGAQERHVGPTLEGAHGHGRELCVEVVGHGEHRARHVVGKDTVLGDQAGEKLFGPGEDLASLVLRHRRGSPHSAHVRKTVAERGPSITHNLAFMRHVLGIDAGGTKTRALLADANGQVRGRGLGGGANLKTHGELEVEKVLHLVIEQAEAEAGTKPDAVALGIAGADRPEDHAVLRAILRRMGFRQRVLVTNDARIAFVAGSPSRVGLALICGTGSIAWGQNARAEIARAGGWGWHVGDEGSGFWIGVRAVRAALKSADGRGPRTALVAPLLDHFGLSGVEEIVRVVYGGDFPRHEIAMFAPKVAEAAAAGDPAAREILDAAAAELAEAAQSVIRRLDLPGQPYDIVLAGGTFAAVPALTEAVTSLLRAPLATVRLLTEEPATGAVRLAMEQLE